MTEVKIWRRLLMGLIVKTEIRREITEEIDRGKWGSVGKKNILLHPNQTKENEKSFFIVYFPI